MSGEMPAALRQAVEALLEGVSRRDLGEAATHLSGRYRRGETSHSAISGDDGILSYLVARMPATYAAVASAMEEISRRAPDFAPASLLDVGAGPGTASWSAIESWPSLRSIILQDHNPAFLRIAGTLAEKSSFDPLGRSRHMPGDLADIRRSGQRAELVVASYALAELPVDRVPGIAADLWNATEAVLLLVEPGTPAGFERIRRARTALVDAGAAMIAPCPHRETCPMIEPDWCHFSVRLSRSRDHRLAKSASLSYEDEKFSYLAVARPDVSVALPTMRVLAKPHRSKAGIDFKLCALEGLRLDRVPHRARDAFAVARRLDWGDAIA